MINVVKPPANDNPRWPDGNAAETIASLATGPAFRPPAAAAGHAVRAACASLSGWLASLPRRAGARLFARNDAEARWRGWQITELRGGLARSYRDPRFEALGVRRELEASLGGLPGPEPRDEDGQDGARP